MFISSGMCPLISVSFKLDNRVHLPDFSIPQSLAQKKSVESNMYWSDDNSHERSLSDISVSFSQSVLHRSFGYCMKPTWTQQNSVQHAKVLDSWKDRDDHATIIALNGFRCSIIPYLNKHDAKVKINERFIRKHPALSDSKIKLTKLRKFKMKLIRLNHSKNFDLWTVALAFCLIEDTLRRGLVMKETLRICCGCCYLLAAKFNEMLTPASVRNLRENIAKILKIDAVNIMEKEFFYFSKLEFSLFREVNEVAPYLTIVESKLPLIKKQVEITVEHFD